MGFLNLFGRKQEPQQEMDDPAVTTTCPHVMLTPRWDSVGDIGHEDKAIGYKCTACGMSFSVEEGHELQNRHIDITRAA